MQSTLKPFNKDEFQKDFIGEKQLILRKNNIIYNYDIRILCYDRVGYLPVVSLIKMEQNKEKVVSFDINGKSIYSGELLIKYNMFEKGDIIYSITSNKLYLFDRYSSTSPGLIYIKAYYCYSNIYFKDTGIFGEIFRLATQEEKSTFLSALKDKYSESLEENIKINNKVIDTNSIAKRTILVRDSNSFCWNVSISMDYIK